MGQISILWLKLSTAKDGNKDAIGFTFTSTK